MSGAIDLNAQVIAESQANGGKVGGPLEGATVLEGAARDRVYGAHAAEYPNFAEYQAGTDRITPVVLLERA